MLLNGTSKHEVLLSSWMAPSAEEVDVYRSTNGPSCRAQQKTHIDSNLLPPGDALKHGFFLELAGGVLNVKFSIRSELKGMNSEI